VLVPMLLALAYIRNFKYLSFTSILGDIAVTAGMLCVVGYGFAHFGSELEWDRPVVSKTLPNFFGGTAFLFAIHVAVLPVMQSMKRPEDFGKVMKIHGR
jgi:amino acid permease